MKTPTDDIFQLVQSMTAAEKRYFKIHFSSEKSLVTKLFNYLNSMKKYDENDVKTHFQKTKLSKNLKVYKIMLMDLLLKSLVSFRYKKNVKNTIRQNIEEIEILIDKNLLSLAFKKLEKTKNLCEKHEEFTYLIAILNLEYELGAFHKYDLKKEEVSLFKTIDSIATTLASDSELKTQNHRLCILTFPLYSIDNANEGILNYKELLLKNAQSFEDDLDTVPFNQFFYTHSILGNIYRILNQPEGEFYHRQKIQTYFDSNKYFIDNKLFEYCLHLYFFASYCIRKNMHEEFDKIINDFKKILKKYQKFSQKLIVIHDLEVKYHLHNKNYFYITNHLESPFLETIEKTKDINNLNYSSSYVLMLMTHLRTGNYEKVQFYLRRVFEQKELGNHFHYFFETIELINHFESGDLDIYQNLLQSKIRKLKREPDYGTPFFKRLISFFSEIVDYNNTITLSVEKLIKETEAINNDGFFNLMNHFILDDWLDALSNEQKLVEYCKATT